MEQLALFNTPRSGRRAIDEKALRVAEFNLLAYGDHERAIQAIEADIGRDERMYERAMVDYRETLRLRGFPEGAKLKDEPKRPEYAIRIKRLAIDWLRSNKPLPEQVWPKAQRGKTER